jgi:peptide chain release factor 1
MRSSWCMSRLLFTQRRLHGSAFSIETLDDRPGFILLKATGISPALTFKDEPGGHRWQRIPPNEKRGRVQTSTVTVAILREPTETEVVINQSDLEIQTVRGSGPGGQHRNKTESCVVITHKPSKVVVRCDGGRSQYQNKVSAMGILRARLAEAAVMQAAENLNGDRRSQLGLGYRGDKTWTIREQDGQVICHVTNKRIRLKDYLRGDF